MRDRVGTIVGAVESFRELGDPETWISRMAKLEKAAFADALRGILNCRYLEIQLARLLREHQATSLPFTSCMLDLDHFKAT
jgi:GGDEF domain-containing protein